MSGMSSGRNAPAARSEGLIVEPLPGETLVYDERCDEAHCLNAVAANQGLLRGHRRPGGLQRRQLPAGLSLGGPPRPGVSLRKLWR